MVRMLDHPVFARQDAVTFPAPAPAFAVVPAKPAGAYKDVTAVLAHSEIL